MKSKLTSFQLAALEECVDFFKKNKIYVFRRASMRQLEQMGLTSKVNNTRQQYIPTTNGIDYIASYKYNQENKNG